MALQPSILQSDLDQPELGPPRAAAPTSPPAAQQQAPALQQDRALSPDSPGAAAADEDHHDPRPGRVMRAVRKNEQQLNSAGSGPSSAGGASARGSPLSASGGVGGGAAGRRRRRRRAADAREHFLRLSAALDPRKLPKRLHDLSTDIMSREMFNPLLAKEIVDEVRTEADSSGAPTIAAVDAVARRRVRALAASDAPRFFLVAAASTSACCAVVGVAKWLLRTVAAPLRLGPLRAGPPVNAVTGLMPTGVYGALLAAYFIFHGAQGALERSKDGGRRRDGGGGEVRASASGPTLLRDARDARVRLAASGSFGNIAAAANSGAAARRGAGQQQQQQQGNGLNRSKSLGGRPSSDGSGAGAAVPVPAGPPRAATWRRADADDAAAAAAAGGAPGTSADSGGGGSPVAAWQRAVSMSRGGPNGVARVVAPRGSAECGGPASPVAGPAFGSVGSMSVRDRARSFASGGGNSDNSASGTPVGVVSPRARPFGAAGPARTGSGAAAAAAAAAAQQQGPSAVDSVVARAGGGSGGGSASAGEGAAAAAAAEAEGAALADGAAPQLVARA